MHSSRASQRQFRQIMRLERLGIAGIALFGRYNYLSARPALPDHAHARDIEICYLAKGRQTYCVAGQTYHLRGGDVFLTFSGETHSTGGNPEEKGVLYWLAIHAPARGNTAFLGLSGPSSAVFRSALRAIPRRHFRGSSKMKDLLDAASSACQEPASPLAGILSAVRELPGENWSVARMAERAGLSTARFKARFKQENGIPPREFVLRTRIEAAAKRLALRRESITDIALDLGFSSSQYFATVYKRHTGATPRGGRRQATAR